MSTWFKSLFFKNDTEKKIQKLNDKISEIENEIHEITGILKNQAELIAVIAGIQCDVVSVVGGNTRVKKETLEDSTESFLMSPSDDDEFIN